MVYIALGCTLNLLYTVIIQSKIFYSNECVYYKVLFSILEGQESTVIELLIQNPSSHAEM
jgi:hypothetical protein